MASQITKFNVGLFMTCGIGLALVAVIWLGVSHVFDKGRNYVTYFDESVQGLDVDSPVKYRGVHIGRVVSITVAPDSKVIEVKLEIEAGHELPVDIIAQLKAVGITGSMFVELDRRKPEEEGFIPSRSDFALPEQVVPSKPSNISELLKGIDDVFKNIESLDLEGISEKTKDALDNFNLAISEANVKGISAGIESSLESARGILNDRRWNDIIASVEGATQNLNSLMAKADKIMTTGQRTLHQVETVVADKQATVRSAVENFRRAMENANLFLEKGTSLFRGTEDSISHLERRLLVVLQNLEKASENLNRLTELLADQPSQLIFGEPPVPRKVEPEVQGK